MRKVKLTNISSMGIVIEDIGVRLNGFGSSIVVDGDLLAGSRIFPTLSHHLKVEEIKRHLGI